jgi:hypothetical protein
MRSYSIIQLGIVAFFKSLNVWKVKFRNMKSLEKWTFGLDTYE